MKILVVKNISREGPGLLTQIAEERGFEITEIDLTQSLEVPQLDAFDAIVMLGGPDSANDSTPKVRLALDIVRKALEYEKPYLGICLGLQLLVKAAGGSVIPNSVAEHGFVDANGKQFNIELTEAGNSSPIFKGLGRSLDVFHLHGETVVLTPEMSLLATGKHCTNQAVQVGSNAFGLQCHFELTPKMFDTWISQDADLLKLNTENLRNHFASIKDNYTQTGQILLNNFLDRVTLN